MSDDMLNEKLFDEGPEVLPAKVPLVKHLTISIKVKALEYDRTQPLTPRSSTMASSPQELAVLVGSD
jgi:hypothetical protein